MLAENNLCSLLILTGYRLFPCSTPYLFFGILSRAVTAKFFQKKKSSKLDSFFFEGGKVHGILVIKNFKNLYKNTQQYA